MDSNGFKVVDKAENTPLPEDCVSIYDEGRLYLGNYAEQFRDSTYVQVMANEDKSAIALTPAVKRGRGTYKITWSSKTKPYIQIRKTLRECSTERGRYRSMWKDDKNRVEVYLRERVE